MLSRSPCKVNCCPVDEVLMCVLSVLMFVSTGAKPAGDDDAGVASAGLKVDDVKSESNECMDFCEPVDISCESNSCANSVKYECLDTCPVGVNVCGAGVDGHDSSNSSNHYVSSTRSEEDVASNEEVDVNHKCLDSDCTRPVLSVDVNSVNASELFPFQINESNEELKQLQRQDADLAPYNIEHLEHSILPSDERDARKVVLGRKQYEMIHGILHYESPIHPADGVLSYLLYCVNSS